MARQQLTKTTAPGNWPTAGVAITMTAADAANKEQFTATGNDLVIAHNTAAGTAYTVTITSIADEKGRTGTITTESVAAAAIRVFGPFSTGKGWIQTDGNIYLEASNAKIKWGIIAL